MNLISLHSCPRSGSTWLQNIFEAHPNIKTFYQPLFSYAFKNQINEDSSKKDFDDFVNNIRNTDDEFCCMKANLHTNNNNIKNVSFKKDIVNTILMKNVHHHNLIETFIKLYPTIKIIGLIRDPCSVIYSQMQAKHEKLEDWLDGKDKNLNNDENFFGFNKWLEVKEIFSYIKKKYPNNIIIVNYEDLVSNTKYELDKICEFCHIYLHKNMLESIDIMKSKNDNYDYSVYKNEDTLNKWKGKLDEKIVSYIINKTIRAGIYVRVYNEKNIIEWMDYHYKCGFDFILFYDDYSEPSVKSIIEDYGKFDKSKYLVLERLFTKQIHNFNNVLNNQNNFKTHILNHIQKHMDYVLYIDIDEYLYLNTYKNIKELIKDYGNFDQLFINMKFFGNFKLKTDNNELIKNHLNCFTYCPTTKSLCKVSSIDFTQNPHFFILNNNNSLTIDINKELIHKGKFKNVKYSESVKKIFFKTNTKEKKIYIAHYYTQNLYRFIVRKVFYRNDVKNKNIYNKLDLFIKNYNRIENKEEYWKNNPKILNNYKKYIKHIKIQNVNNKDIYNFYYDIDTTTNNKNKIEN